MKKSDFVTTGYQVYEQRHAINGTSRGARYFVSRDKFLKMKRFAVSPGDFVVSCSGTIGRIFQIPDGAPPGIINQALLKIAVDRAVIDPGYFLAYFTSKEFQSQILDSTQGGAMKNLVGMPIFRRTPIGLPSLAEQRAIANAISAANEAVSLLEELIAKKQAIKQGMMQQLLTGQTRLPGFGGAWHSLAVASKSILKARIGWQGLKADEYRDSGTFRLVGGTEFIDGRVDWARSPFVDQWRYDQDSYIQLRPGDVLLTKDGSIGKIAYVDSLPGPATLNSGVFVIRPVREAYDPHFLFFMLRSRTFEEFLARLSAGSTISHLYQRDLVTLVLEMPPTVEEQRAIARVLTDVETELQALQDRLAKERAIKTGMMQQLLTGRVRLSLGGNSS